MNDNDGLERLGSFYRNLDAIPTPALRPKPRWGLLKLATAPLGAYVVAYLFLSYCAAGSSDTQATVPLRNSLDRYALDEWRELSRTRHAPHHTSRAKKFGVAI